MSFNNSSLCAWVSVLDPGRWSIPVTSSGVTLVSVKHDLSCFGSRSTPARLLVSYGERSRASPRQPAALGTLALSQPLLDLPFPGWPWGLLWDLRS